MKLSAIRTIAGNIQDGAWVDDIPLLTGLALKVRGDNNTDASELLRKLVQAVPPDQRRDGLSEADAQRIGIEVAVQAILLDWTLNDDDGAPIPCTPDAARELLTELPPLRDAVAYASRVVGTHGTAALAADVKN